LRCTNVHFNVIIITLQFTTAPRIVVCHEEMETAQQESAVTKHIGQLKFDCVLCSEVYKNPRLLPCSHTYCLKCLERLGTDEKPGHCRYYLVKICRSRVGCCKTSFLIYKSSHSGVEHFAPVQQKLPLFSELIDAVLRGQFFV